MERVLRRTALAKVQAARKATAQKGKNQSVERRIRDDREGYIRRSRSQNVRNARQARREDYELGPLAPRRDVGDYKESYGTMDPRVIQGSEKPRDERIKFWNIVEGDRVVVLEGVDKGKIGEVKSTSKEKGEVTVNGLNMVDLQTPSWLREESTPPVQSLELGLPLSSVRLVHALTDPETGRTRDVIVKKIATSNIYHDRHYGIKNWSRYIAGLNVKIPWPKREPKEYNDTAADTLRIEVEAQTFVPTLLRPPMPMSVMDELRNKYSKFRDRHDEDYVAQKTAEDEEAKQKQRRDRMIMDTPLKQYNRQVRKDKKAKGTPKLTVDMMQRIGEVIARNRGVPAERQTAPAPA